MPAYRQYSRIDTVELKNQLFKKLGKQKAEKYFYILKKLLDHKLSKWEFNRLCYNTIGKENIALHNRFIQSILGNACLAFGPPIKQAATGHSRTSKISNGHFGDSFPPSPRRARSIISRDAKLNDRPSPLGPCGKVAHGHVQEVTNSCDLYRSKEQHSVVELISIGSKALLEVASVEDGEEVEQVRCSPCVQSRSPVRAPLGIPQTVGSIRRKAFHLSKSTIPESCCSSSELPDTRSLQKHMEHKLEIEGLGMSVECADLLNRSLDAYLKRLIKPCMDLARSRHGNRRISHANGKIILGMNGVRQGQNVMGLNQCYYASLQDFQVAMESNPQLLGGDWPLQLEKISSRALE